MKKIIIALVFLCVGQFYAKAQIFDPVKWTTSVEKVSETEYDLIAKATIDGNWHLYSQHRFPKNQEEGPIATAFEYTKNSSYTLDDAVREEKGSVELSKPFGNIPVKYFGHKATFAQRVKVSGTLKKIEGFVNFMVCDDERCLPPTDVDLSFDLTKTSPAKIYATLYDETKVREITKKEIESGNTDGHKTKIHDDEKKEEATIEENDKLEENKSFWGIFIAAFLSGFVALLTPCVFPLIPMTVSFFTKQSKNKAVGIKNATIYGISIVVIYVLLGTVVTLIFGADALNALASDPIFNIIFFLLLTVFAVSFLGAFEITLPSSWGTKVDAQADKGGLIGIFFMALALAIVSFSCTGPIVGTLLVQAASKGGLAPIIGMLGFSLAIAIPFGLFAAFPGWLNSIPKSGGWLNTVKVVLGFLELALAFKFLSNADYVLQLHLFEREAFIAIWITVFGALAFYLFGKIKLPHDSPLTHISVGRLSLGLITLSFTIYMIPGLWGAPLNLISAFPPPHDYSESPYGVGSVKSTSVNHIETLPEGAHLMAPHNIMVFHDYDTGLTYAKKVGKPVMIDFTGYTCVNCRKMEQNVWVKPKILEILKRDVVLISLYVDDKKPLPKDQIKQYVSRPGKMLKTYGNKWADLQASKYNANAQPMYVLMDHEEKNLIKPVPYTPNVDEYHAWLKKGVSKFKK